MDGGLIEVNVWSQMTQPMLLLRRQAMPAPTQILIRVNQAVSAAEITNRHGDSPLIATPHNRRWVTLAGYETGKVDFATLLDAQRQIRKARLDLLKVQLEQQMRLAEIERIVGEDL